MQISWEVRNRFRLFREERDFLLHTESARGRQHSGFRTGAGIAERWPRLGTQHREPALYRPRRAASASRAPATTSRKTTSRRWIILFTVKLTGEVPVGATCAWSIDDGQVAAAIDARLRRAVNLPGPLWPSDHRLGGRLKRSERRSTSPPRSGSAISSSPASATASHPAKAIPTGRSLWRTKASASALISEPRARNIIGRAAPATKAGGPARRPTSLQNWQRQSALWFNSACHRSLYSYQTRTALELAVRYPHIAVTYLPLACTGATIADGLLGPQRARECLPRNRPHLPGHVNAQLSELREALAAASAGSPTASSTWCCCRSAPTTSIFPAWWPTRSSTPRPNASCLGVPA